MEKLKQMKECLIGIVEGQIYGNIEKVDAKELGEAVDMIKDLAEAIYYCTITEAMKEDEYNEKHSGVMYYAPKKMKRDSYPVEIYDPYMKDKYPHDMDRDHLLKDRRRQEMLLEYPGHMQEDHGKSMRSVNEGKSGARRKMYMDGKGVKDKTHQMQELENYMQELTSDITEMIYDASPEEKQLLQSKITTLAAKIK